MRKDETVSAYQSPFEFQNVRILYPFLPGVEVTTTSSKARGVLKRLKTIL